MKGIRPAHAPYTVQSVERACDVLTCLAGSAEPLRLNELAARTGLDPTTAFRILRTFLSKGLIEKVGRCQYRTLVRLPQAHGYRLGYAAQSTEFAFSREVTRSIRLAAQQEHITLVEADNMYSRKEALRNASLFVKNRVDLVMEFQTDEHVAPMLMSMYQQAGIPVIAIEIPHPGATYFGANNYAAGLIGGEYLARWAGERWGGEVEEILLLELPRAGPLPASRLTGCLEGMHKRLPSTVEARVTRLNGNGQFGRSMEAVRGHLRNSPQRSTLVAAINDPSAIGALRAFEESGRLEHCAVMGHNASLEARVEMRRAGSRLVGSVAYTPERYGEQIIPLALKILEKKHVPPAVFVKHMLVTPHNVNHLYPNDSLLSASELDALMLQSAATPKTRADRTAADGKKR